MAGDEFKLREPPDPPSIGEFAATHRIKILHPGYPDGKNCLFQFNACDDPRGGLHKVVVLTACGVIAGNVWDGYLSTSRDGPPVDEAIQVLRDARDTSCRLTGWHQMTEAAHIVPREESDWFSENEMQSYSPDTLLSTTDNAANEFLLRRDVYRAYDQSMWTIVPKKTISTSAEALWAFHLLAIDEEYKVAFQNVNIRPLDGVSSEYLLAGFALAIFPMLTSFLRNSAAKALMGKSIAPDPRGRIVDGKECGKLFPTDKIRSRSHRKRKLGDDEEVSGETCNESHGNARSMDEHAGSWQRGRKRSRLTPGSAAKQSGPKPAEETDGEPMIKKKTATPPSSILPEPTMSRPTCRCSSPTYELPINLLDQGLAKTEEPEAEVVGDVCCAPECRTMKDLKRLGSLRQQALEKERSRSHVGGWWDRQVKWAREKAQDTFSGRDWEQLMWVRGHEVLDKRTGDYFESTEEFLELVGPWASPQVEQDENTGAEQDT
ncbi:MAG: hypothetical protein LQ345_007223 [Seirophora villosa]|nr:MAG: hypothetical protein LQ345_007223 [Seirophora villosa]